MRVCETFIGRDGLQTEAKAWRVKKRETAKRDEKAKRGREHASEGRRMGKERER